jgi:hypothetical protein
MFTRSLLCAVIQCAVNDVQSETVFKQSARNSQADECRRSAIHFLKSDFFNDLCVLLALQADKIRSKAFMAQKPKE